MAQLTDANGNPSDEGTIVDAHGKSYQPDKGDELALPYQFTFSSIIQGASKSFLALQFDEAIIHNRYNALTMRRDCRLMGWLRERKEGTCSRKWHLECDCEDDPVQVAVRDGMTKIIQSIPRLKRIFRWLLEALWYGRYGVQLVWHEVEMNLPAVPVAGLFPLGNDREAMLQKHLSGGGELKQAGDKETAVMKPQSEMRKVTTVKLARPVNGDKINFLWDGTPLIGVYGAYQSLRDEGATVHENRQDLDAVFTWDNDKPVMVFSREWRERLLLHTYDPDDADYYEAEKAGGVFGVGIRSRIYWLNWLRQDYAAWINDVFDRLGIGILTIKYEAGNIKAKEQAENLAQRWNRRSVLAVPVSPDQLRSGGGIEVIDVPTAGALVVQQLVEYADKHIERYILGQSMSSGESGREGLGGTAGPAAMATTTKHQLLQADAEELEETITGSDDEPGLCSVIQKWTYPGTIDKFRVRFRFVVDEPNPKEKIDAIVALAGAGVEFGQEYARNLTGAPAPGDGEPVFGGKTPEPVMPGQMPGEDGEKPGDDEEDGKPFEANGQANGNGKAAF